MTVTYAPSSPIPAALTPTDTFSVGTGAGDYTTTSTTFVTVDSANLAFTKTVPLGQKLIILLMYQSPSPTNNAGQQSALNIDGVVKPISNDTLEASGFDHIRMFMWEIAGDGASHTGGLQFKAASTFTATVRNTAAGGLPAMLLRLQQAN